MEFFRRRPRALPWVALLVVWFVWGSTYLGIRAAVDTIPPLTMAGTRYLIAGALLFAVVGRRHARGDARPTRRQIVYAGLVALLLLVGGNGLLSVGERWLPSGPAALIVATVPIWMVLFNAVVTRTMVSWRMMLALVLGTTGVGVLMGGPGDQSVALIPALIVVFASASWAAGSVLARRVDLPSHPLVVTAIEMMIGGAVLLVLGAVTGELATFDIRAVSLSSAIGLAWLILPGSILAFSAYVYANKTLPNDAVATYAYVNPIVAVALGVLIGQESATSGVLAGGAIIVGSVVLVVTGRRKRATPPTTEPTPTSTTEPTTTSDLAKNLEKT